MEKNALTSFDNMDFFISGTFFRMITYFVAVLRVGNNASNALYLLSYFMEVCYVSSEASCFAIHF